MPRSQKTPKGHEIPIPTRADFLQAMKKAAKPRPKGSTRKGRTLKKG